MKNYLLTWTMVLSIVSVIQAQHYNQSAGVRLGHTSGLTYKKFVAETEAVEFLVSGRRDGLQVVVMWEKHHPMEFSFNENFYVYYGLGGHAGYEEYDRFKKVLVPPEPYNYEYEEGTFFVMGIDVVLGLEYRWLSVPMTIAFDVKPYINYIGMRYARAIFWDSALSFKYVF